MKSTLFLIVALMIGGCHPPIDLRAVLAQPYGQQGLGYRSGYAPPAASYGFVPPGYYMPQPSYYAYGRSIYSGGVYDPRAMGAYRPAVQPAPVAPPAAPTLSIEEELRRNAEQERLEAELRRNARQ